MANFVSPGVYTIEKDVSDYTPSINTSVVGLVGFASKGPTNEATLITSQNALLRTFGSPSEDLPGQALEAALEILEQTSVLYFVRSATADAVEARVDLGLGACPSIHLENASYGIGTPLTLRVQVYDDAGVAQFTDNSSAGRDYVIPAGTFTGDENQGKALAKFIGGSLDQSEVAVITNDTDLSSGVLVGRYAGARASLGVSAVTGTTFDAANGVSSLLNVYAPSAATNYGVSGSAASAVRAFGATYKNDGTADSVFYKVESQYPGEGYNGGLRDDGSTSGNSITITALGNQNASFILNDEGAAVETFKVSLASGTFIETVINTGTTNVTSEYIKGSLFKGTEDITPVATSKFEDLLGTVIDVTSLSDTDYKVTSRYLETDTNPDGTGASTQFADVVVSQGCRFNKLVEVTAADLASGTNGIGTTENDRATALIGDASQDPKTGMQSLDDRNLNIGIALVPGISTQTVQNSLITLAETTQDFLALVAPPYGLTTQQAINWTNGQETSRTSPINSSYAAVYWPWVKTYSTFDSKDIWLDPTIFAARQMAYTDTVADSWFAPAGFRRGRLTKPTEVEVKLSQGDRDSLYSGGNIVNPVVSFPQQGITIFGQRTGQREPTALDRINVRRLMIYIRKVILASTQRLIFEPNDEFTWAEVENLLNPFLDDIRRRRGITEFRVVCDETTNTPVRVDRNEMWTKVIVKPTKTAEIIVFEINLTNQSADLGTI